MDTAVATLKLTSMKTPWGEIQWLEETGNVNSLVLRVSQTFEFDKPYVAKFNASMKALQDAVKPVADFVASPEKAERKSRNLRLWSPSDGRRTPRLGSCFKSSKMCSRRIFKPRSRPHIVRGRALR